MTLELNEITVLMAINSVLMIALMGMFLHLTVTTLFEGNNAPARPDHYRRD